MPASVRKHLASATGVACTLLCIGASARAQAVHLPASLTDSATLAREMPAIARTLLARNPSPDDRFRLELVAGRYDAALRTLARLRAERMRTKPSDPQARASVLQYEIWLRARAENSTTSDTAFSRAFRTAFAPLDDRKAALVMRAMAVPPIRWLGGSYLELPVRR